MPLDLTGKYTDADARVYAVMQDDLQRTDRSAYVLYARVMRRREENVRSGMIHVSDDIFEAAGPDDGARNETIAAALVRWIASQPDTERFFQLRAMFDRSGEEPTVVIVDETVALRVPQP